MQKYFIPLVTLIAAISFTTQATAATTIDLQDFNGTLIDNKWQDLSAVGIGIVQTSSPYSKSSADGSGSITLSPIVDFGDNSHIHVNGGDGNAATPTTPFIHGDVGGIFIDGSGSLDTFSFQSMDILHSTLLSVGITHANATITVRGFLGGTNNMLTGITEADGTTLKYTGGEQVAEATLLNDVTGTFDFLAADPRFSKVDYVEFFFTDFYRLKPSSEGDEGLDFEFDNIVIGEASIPVDTDTVDITIDLQDFNGTLIDNKWQDLSAVGIGIVQTSSPYSKSSADGSGSITLSPIVDFGDNSHIHVNGGDGNAATPTTPFIHGDVGGIFIDGSGSLDTFSFQSMDILHSTLLSVGITHANATITVRGFLGGTNNMLTGITEADGTTLKYTGGEQVAEATLLNDVTGTFDFLAADPRFSKVDYVEFFFTDFYRLKPSSEGDEGLDFEFDNIVIGKASMPVDTNTNTAASWLFGTGIIGKRKQKAFIIQPYQFTLRP